MIFRRALLCALTAASFAAPSVLAQEISLQPTSVEMIAEPGLRQRQALTVSNAESGPAVALTIGLADWTLSRSGAVMLDAPGLSEASAADWIRFSPAFVSLQPGESRQILVDIITPAKPARPGAYRIALLASAIVADTRPGAEGLSRKIEKSTLFYLTPPDAISNPAIEDIRLTQKTTGERELVLVAGNSGNAHARLEGAVRIEGQGEPVDIPLANLVILEGTAREFALPLPDNLPGRARLVTDFRNIHAPQSQTGSAPVGTYSAPLDAGDPDR